MSVFKVALTQGRQGSLDEQATGVNNKVESVGTGGGNVVVGSGVSIQRTVYVMGPHKINRKLKDGDTFTDSNYWKRYCATPTGPLANENAIVSLVSDDGSVYDDNNPGASTYPKVYNVSVPGNSTVTSNNALGNLADILSDTGSYAVYAQLSLSTGTDVKVTMNGSTVFDLPSTLVQIFNPGDFQITKFEFANTTGTSATVQVLLSVASTSNS